MLSADRPLTESEVKFLQYVRQWGKKVVFVVNKVSRACCGAQTAAACWEQGLPLRCLLYVVYGAGRIGAACTAARCAACCEQDLLSLFCLLST